MTPKASQPDDDESSSKSGNLSRRRFLQATGATAGAVAVTGVLGTARASATTAPSNAALPFGKEPPFSFTYDGQPSAQLLRRWHRSVSRRGDGHGATETTTTWTDPKSGLRIRWIATHYHGLPTISWVVHFDNTGSARTPLLADVLAADFPVRGGDGDWSIHTNNGSTAQVTDFAPLDLALVPSSFRLFTTNGGRPTNGNADAGTAWIYLTGSSAPGYVDADQHYATVSGASASLTFSGTSITWIGAKNIDVGIADVYIDGVKQASADGYATSWLKQQRLFHADGLSDGQHTIKVVVTGKSNPAGIGTIVNIDAFEVGTASGTSVVNDNDPSVVYANPLLTRTNITNGWPYFNIDWGTGGIVVALGWPGQWALQTTRSGTRDLTIRAGMSHNAGIADGDDIAATELTRLWLDPGESIRTPLVVVQPWVGGDWIDAQNTWREWFIEHQMPQVDGKPVPPLAPTQSNDYFPEQYDTAQDELEWLSAYGEHSQTPKTGGPIDHWWIDAGWYGLPDGAHDWNHPGTWEPDPVRYPDGLAPITDKAHALGMRTIVWFEPERVRPDTWIYDNHPEWLLKSSAGQADNFLLDFSNPAVGKWASDHIGDLIESQHIDVYREDFNIDPLPFWNYNDPEDRRGITQIRYVEGHLGYWKALQQRHRGLVIDTCASGGRRMDVETLSLAINLLRSDHVLDALGNQVHQFGVSRWVALSGSVVRITGDPADEYNARSSMAPSIHIAVDVPSAAPEAWQTMKRMTQEWRRLNDDLYGDYYPLLDFSADQSAWTAWAFNRPRSGTGFLQAFRRPGSTQTSQRLVLRGLNSRARYRLYDEADGSTRTVSGRELMTTGVLVTLDGAPAATTIRWRRG